jgi:NitT/TauT family transport system substrate-binding protein
VRLGEGAGAQPALGALIQGQEDLVVLPGVFALSAISRGMPVKLVALYHPSTPMAFISHLDNPVRVPRDLEGKAVATSVGETATTYLDVLCAKNGVDCGKIKRVQMEIQSRMPQFMAGKVDVVSVYQTNDLPLVEQQTGKKFVVLDLVQYGLTVPGMAVVSTDAVIARKAEALKKFLRATAQGIQDARRSPEEAARIMIKSWPAAPPLPVVTAQVKATLDAIPVVASRPVGWIEDATIRHALELLKSAKEVDATRAPADYYTNPLLE